MQWSLVKRILVHWLTFFVLLVIVLGVAHYFKSMLFPNENGAWAFFAQNWLTFLVLIAAIPVFVYDTLRMSNRFAGPLARLRESLRELASGDTVQPLTVRRGDYLSDLVDSFNEVIARFSDETPEVTSLYKEKPKELEVVER